MGFKVKRAESATFAGWPVNRAENETFIVAHKYKDFGDPDNKGPEFVVLCFFFCFVLFCFVFLM